MGRLAQNHSECKPVVSLGSNGLKHRCAQSRFSCQKLCKSLHALDIRIIAIGIKHPSFADNIVRNNDGPGSREL